VIVPKKHRINIILATYLVYVEADISFLGLLCRCSKVVAKKLPLVDPDSTKTFVPEIGSEEAGIRLNRPPERLALFMYMKDAAHILYQS